MQLAAMMSFRIIVRISDLRNKHDGGYSGEAACSYVYRPTKTNQFRGGGGVLMHLCKAEKLAPPPLLPTKNSFACTAHQITSMDNFLSDDGYRKLTLLLPGDYAH